MLVATPTWALKIIINSNQIGARPISIVPFYTQGTNIKIANIINQDLLLSGVFKPVKISKLPAKPKTISEIDFKKWRPLADAMIIGSVIKTDGKINITVELINVYKKFKLITLRYQLKNQTPKLIRKIAHKISDIIYLKLTGTRGIFTTKLAYVTVSKVKLNKLYSLEISGIDGKDSTSIFQSYQSIMSPAWSPDGKNIAFVSFENNRAEIWVKNLKTNQHRQIIKFRGNVSSPSWSPDGSKLAVTLVKDGNAEIYIVDLVAKTTLRVTRHRTVDTEAVWAPNGKGIYFLSDRNGQAQIYYRQIEGNKLGKIIKITKTGNYNTSPDVAADNQNLVMLHRTKGKYKIAIQNLANGAFKILSKTNRDEAPSFAPNSRMVVYASQLQGRGVITITNKLGTVHQTYSSKIKDVREPAWSPYLN